MRVELTAYFNNGKQDVPVTWYYQAENEKEAERMADRCIQDTDRDNFVFNGRSVLTIKE